MKTHLLEDRARSEEFVQRVLESGFAVIENVLDEDNISQLIRALESGLESESSLRMRGGVFAIRNLLEEIPEISTLAESRAIRQ